VSSEKNDKDLPEEGSPTPGTTEQSSPMPATSHRPVAAAPQRQNPAVAVDLRQRRRAVEGVLRCVSSGYLSGGCSCTRTVPASAAAAGWSAEQARGPGSRFFSFAFKGQVWLGFGLEDGSVRGVYCPAHRAEREARSCGCEAQHYAPAVATGA
jgi:hypothetical protein